MTEEWAWVVQEYVPEKNRWKAYCECQDKETAKDLCKRLAETNETRYRIVHIRREFYDRR